MKEIYTSNHIWTLFEDFLVDMARVRFMYHLSYRCLAYCSIRSSLQRLLQRLLQNKKNRESAANVSHVQKGFNIANTNLILRGHMTIPLTLTRRQRVYKSNCLLVKDCHPDTLCWVAISTPRAIQYSVNKHMSRTSVWAFAWRAEGANVQGNVVCISRRLGYEIILANSTWW